MAEDSRKLFVAGLPDSISEEVLRQLFEATGGNVVEVSLPKDRATGRPRGFGFVTLSTSEEANTARESLDGSYQGGKAISVRPFQAEPPRRDGAPGMGPGGGGRAGGDRGPSSGGGMGAAGAPDRTLYVGNLPYDASTEEVEGLINSTGSGPVVRVHLPMDADGRKRGFGFVTMASADAAKAAIEALRGADVRGRRLVVNLAHPKGEKPAHEGGGSGGPPRSFGERSFSGGSGGPPPPPPQRRTFDDRRRRGPSDDGPPAGGAGGGGGGGGRRNKNDWARGGRDDWDDE
ncbi:MAG: RNA-binding protein [Polyangiaceae bacterium]